MDKQREFSKAQLVSLSSRANLHLLIQGKGKLLMPMPYRALF